MTMKTVYSLFDTYDHATAAVRMLESDGVPSSDISIVGDSAAARDAARAEGSPTAEGATTGASVGAVVGGGAGLLAGLGMMAIPGIGPVVAAGWFAVTALGAVAGASVGGAAGGVIGAMTDSGVSSEAAHVYAEGIRRGGTLVSVRVDELRADAIEQVLNRHPAVNLTDRERQYRADGWTGFQQSSEPYAHPISSSRGVEQERV